MKICLINNLYKPFARGGAEKVAETIAQGLIQAGHEVIIITTRPRFGNWKLEIGNSDIYYIKSLYYNLNRFPVFIRLIWHIWDMFNFINYFKIKKILLKEKPDAVITNNLMGLGFLTVFAIKKLKIKLVHIVHDAQLIHPSGVVRWGHEGMINSFSARNYAGLMSWLADSPPIVIFPSRWLRNMHLEKIFFIKSQRIILPNPVEAMPERSAELRGEIFKFLYLGQIEKHKGADLLIQAFKKIKAEYQGLELLIAGTGADLARLKLLGEDDSRVKFLGWQSRAEAGKLLTTCQALVLPTLCHENCPAAILEAFSAGLPVIAADLGGIQELLSQNAGLLFKPGESDDLAEKMRWLLNNQGQLAEMITRGREKAALCSPENYVKELEKLLK
ncbi:MAG: glycosyltransferase [bacterium]|nr:glycosyltransferase [bacterium]